MGVALQEVVRRPAGNMGLSSPWSRIKLQERILEGIVEFHDGGLVATTVAVVRCTEDGHYVLIMTPVVTLQINKCNVENEFISRIS